MNVMTQYSATHDYDRDLRFSAMFEAAAIGIGICGLDGRILEANPALAKMLGYSREELTGAHAHELYPEFRADCRTDGRSGLRSQFRRAPFDANRTHEERLLGELVRGERSSFEIEKRCPRKDGSALWGHLTVSLARDNRLQPAFLIAMLADATERKRVEEHLREAEKMEVIGRLAGGIAHDFNNLLTGILLYCDLLSAGLSSARVEPTGLIQHIDEIRMAGEQGAALTQQLLAIARKQAAEPRPLLINEIVAAMERLLRRLIGEPIELVTTLDPSAGPVLADLSQLRQVVLNLVLNARDALPHGGKIRLVTRAVEFPNPSEPRNPRPSVSLAVKDNGCGMDEETRLRLFEPFFTTKNPGEGTGLGLATVQRIVSEAGGVIQLESELGQGTCIEVFFPAIETRLGVSEEISRDVSIEEPRQPARAPEPPCGRAAVPTASQTILLVDDHAPARRSMQRILLDNGYQILPASSGRQALKIFAEHASAVGLLIADYVMPGMNGKDLAESLRRLKPDLKVLLVSGYHHTPLDPAVSTLELIRKPFSGKALIERVGEVMHRAD